LPTKNKSINNLELYPTTNNQINNKTTTTKGFERKIEKKKDLVLAIF